MSTIKMMRTEVIANEVEFAVIDTEKSGNIEVYKSNILGSLIAVAECNTLKRKIDRAEALRIGESVEYFSSHKCNGESNMEEYLLGIYTMEALQARGLTEEQSEEMREYLRKNYKQFKSAFIGARWCENNKVQGVDEASVEALKIVGTQQKKHGDELLKALTEGKTTLATKSMREFQKKHSGNEGGSTRKSDSEKLRELLALLLPMKEELEKSESDEAGALYDYLVDINLYAEEEEEEA